MIPERAMPTYLSSILAVNGCGEAEEGEVGGLKPVENGPVARERVQLQWTEHTFASSVTNRAAGRVLVRSVRERVGD